ncbi:MAG: DNA repair protein RadA [Clostridia bacterium]|nr:DNA repair protein RadA [Clostridia bacterium]
MKLAGSKLKSLYICSECGYECAKWYGKCPSCGEWNTLNEEIRESVKSSSALNIQRKRPSSVPVQITEITTEDEQRYFTGLKELDRVLGGGIVKGSLVLLGGDPGIGKSTILMQVCSHLGKILKILYISGEESRRQIKLRAERLGVNCSNLYVMTETDIEVIADQIQTQQPDLVMIDSIQTMNFKELSSSPGSVTQVRECTNILMRTSKSLDIPCIVVGHVNKDGAIAGPKVLEHIVDAVLYFEGDKQMSYRILRAVKNRYGSTNEIGVFQMNDTGLSEVENPSMMLLSGRPKNVSGTCVACTMEGSRPILAEIQGLVTNSGYGNARRMSTGFDYNRMSMLLAVLEKRCGYFFSSMDAYVNVIGGLRLDEPATDLALALALVSSLKDIVVSEDLIAFGEVGLTGEIRSVNNASLRVTEAARLGFRRCIMPYHNLKALNLPKDCDIEVIAVRTIRDAVDALGG